MFNRQEVSLPVEEDAVVEVEEAPEAVEETPEVVEEAVVVEEAPAPAPVYVPQMGDKYPGVLALTAGQKNDSVRKVQAQLSSKGFAVAVSGNYDRATENAVASFCKSMAIHSDGTSVGPKTWKHLFG